MYTEGAGVEKDMQEATKWLRKAADLGDERASSMLKEISEKNREK